MHWKKELERREMAQLKEFRAMHRRIKLQDQARVWCVQATANAEDEGREFTRIYWYYSDEPNSKPILTMWDMNESPEVALNKRYFIHAQL